MPALWFSIPMAVLTAWLGWRAFRDEVRHA